MGHNRTGFWQRGYGSEKCCREQKTVDGYVSISKQNTPPKTLLFMVYLGQVNIAAKFV